MTNSKLTKRALLTSSISLLLCFTMLLGTTFAWFTDSAATGSNVIKSGNLDVVVEYTLDGKIWNDLDGADDLFKDVLWEPGHTRVVALKIKNNGSLALKYTANMNIVEEIIGKSVTGEDIVLSDILTVSTLVQQANDAMGVGGITLGLAFAGEDKVGYENTAKFKDANILRENQELAPGIEHYLIVKVDMAETVGNEANHNGTDIPTINFGINVLATQFTYENDSFGNQYDKDAFVADEYVTTADGLIEALEGAGEGEVIGLMNNIKIDPANMSNAYGTTGINIKNGQILDGNGYTLDIKGAGGTWDSGINTTGGTIRNLTVTGSFRGIFINHNSSHSEPVVLEKVITRGTTYTISCDQGMNQTLKAKDCEFYGWTSFAATLGNATFNKCKFGEGSGYAYCRPYAPTTFVGCDFEAGFEMDPRAAVTFENCTIGGVALTADNLATLVTSNIANATVK